MTAPMTAERLEAIRQRAIDDGPGQDGDHCRHCGLPLTPEEDMERYCIAVTGACWLPESDDVCRNDRGDLLAEIDRLRAMLEPTRGALINEAASLGAAAVRAEEAVHRMPRDTLAQCEARHAAWEGVFAARERAENAWRAARKATEAGAPVCPRIVATVDGEDDSEHLAGWITAATRYLELVAPGRYRIVDSGVPR